MRFLLIGLLFSFFSFADKHDTFVPVTLLENGPPVSALDNEIDLEEQRYNICLWSNVVHITNFTQHCLSLMPQVKNEKQWYAQAMPCFKYLADQVERAQQNCQDKAEL